jgi:hypothetical protein
MTTVAALFVAKGGCYFGLDGVDPWDEARDARLYAGPHPVVAHPPCERWGVQWHGCRPAGDPKRGIFGADNGCFSFALACVRRFGGILEHPAKSGAWATFGLPIPPAQGWAKDGDDGWTCYVEQGHYGYPANKPTWLYVVGDEPPELRWGPSGAGPLTGSLWDRQGDRSKTPPEFRDLLLNIARSARR